MRTILILLAITCFLSLPVAYANQTGAELFHSTELGKNGKSCASCHPAGKGLEKIGDFDETMLKEIINFCIRDAMKGEMLPPESVQLSRLEKYLRSLNSVPPK